MGRIAHGNGYSDQRKNASWFRFELGLISQGRQCSKALQFATQPGLYVLTCGGPDLERKTLLNDFGPRIAEMAKGASRVIRSLPA